MFIIQRILKQHVAFGCNKKRGKAGDFKLKSPSSYFQITSLASSVESYSKLARLKSLGVEMKIL